MEVIATRRSPVVLIPISLQPPRSQQESEPGAGEALETPLLGGGELMDKRLVLKSVYVAPSGTEATVELAIDDRQVVG